MKSVYVVYGIKEDDSCDILSVCDLSGMAEIHKLAYEKKYPTWIIMVSERQLNYFEE